MLALLVVPNASAQRIPGLEATVPKKKLPAGQFEVRHPRAHSYLFPDGDPTKEDAPRVVALAGGGEVWFGDYYLTAQNILLFTDAADSSTGPAPSPTFPHGVAPPTTGDGLPAGFGAGGGLLPVSTKLGALRELYAEGNVYITQGENKIIQADRAYFHLIEDRSLLIGGEIRTNLASVDLNTISDEKSEERDARAAAARDRGEIPVPIVIRAAEIRGVSRGLYEADNAQLTTSTFGKPGYHVAMDRLTYEERALELGGRVTGLNNRLVLGDVPLITLPYLTIRTGVESPFPLIGAGIGASSRFGAFIETRWGSVFEDAGNEFNQKLGIEDGSFQGLWFADINLYSKRGLGLGAGLEYETKDKYGDRYFGRTDFFAINDISGDDETSRQDNSGLRGQLRTQNRVFLPDAWQLDTELNLVSDRTFLREFREQQFRREKEPETYVYLNKLDEDTAVTALARVRINDWQTQTSYLPQATYDVVSRPIAEFPRFADVVRQPEPVRAYWTHRSEAGFVNRQVGDFGDRAEGSAFRVDDVERLNMPFEAGIVGVDPYVEGRFTLWGGDGLRDGGGAFRAATTVGFNASTQFWKTDPDVESETWNIHGIRHIVIPNLRYRWTFLSTEHANDLVPYDRVEQFDELHALVPGILSRYETKRNTRKGPETVSFLEFDIQQPFVFDNARDDDFETVSPLFMELRYRPDLERYLLRNSRFRVSTNVGWETGGIDSFRTEFTTEPGPDFFARVAYSYARRGRVSPTLLFEGFAPRPLKNQALNALTLEFGWQATRLWEFVVLQQFEVGGNGGGGASRLAVRRRTADWMFELGFGGSAAGLGSGLGLTVSPIAFFQRPERDRFRNALSDGYDLTPTFDERPFSYGPALEPPEGYRPRVEDR